MPTPTITLTVGTEWISLHRDLMWVDRINWSPVRQTVEFGLTGAPIVHIGAKIKGREITLQPENEDTWMTSDLVEAVKLWAAVPGKLMTLNIHGEDYQVIFRHSGDGGGLEATPVVHFNDVVDTDFFLCVFRFLEV